MSKERDAAKVFANAAVQLDSTPVYLSARGRLVSRYKDGHYEQIGRHLVPANCIHNRGLCRVVAWHWRITYKKMINEEVKKLLLKEQEEIIEAASEPTVVEELANIDVSTLNDALDIIHEALEVINNRKK